MPYKKFKVEINRLLVKSQAAGGYEISFTDKEDIGTAHARCTYHIAHRWCRFSFNTKLVKDKNINPISAAKHEFGHFLMARMDWLAGCRYIAESETTEETENFARIMERLL